MPLERRHIPRDCRLNAAGMPPDAAGTSLEAPRMPLECHQNVAGMPPECHFPMPPFSYAAVYSFQMN